VAYHDDFHRDIADILAYEAGIVSAEKSRLAQAADYLRLMRPVYLIKSVFIAPGIVLAFYFHTELSLYSHAFDLLLAIAGACLTASSNYVINEIRDARGDAMHPVKRYRPIPLGSVRIAWAYALWAVLALLGFICAAKVNGNLLASCLLLWVQGLAYNVPPVRMKDIPYCDVLSESINNPIRVAIGWFAMGLATPPPMSALLAFWMLGAFLMAIKRFAELRHIGDAAIASAYRKSFRWYNEERLLASILLYAALFGLFSGIFIARYCFRLAFAAPFVAAWMLVYFRLGLRPNSPAVYPETLWRHRSITISALLTLGMCAFLMFVDLRGEPSFFAPRVDAVSGQ
jgi:4-hydroxybenzoate polyprenyltransferase